MRTLKITTIVIWLIGLMLMSAADAVADTVTWTNDSNVSTGATRGFKSPEIKRNNLKIEGAGDAASLVIGDVGLAFWKFNESTGIDALDDTGNGHTASLLHYQGVGPTRETTGRTSAFVSFDGVGDYVDCGLMPDLSQTSAFTMLTWVKVADGGQVYYIASLGADKYSILMTYALGNLNYQVANGSISYGGCAAGVTAGTWFHTALVYDGTQAGNSGRLKIYINGSMKTLNFSGTIPPQTGDMTSAPLYLGGMSAGVLWLEGSLDNFRIYKRALNADEIAADMNIP